jgi:membrane-anchored protein YejM (alkaline phosphatase superfamily)
MVSHGVVFYYGANNVIEPVLSVTIAILGYLVYRRERFATALSIGLAFGLFGLLHFVTLVGLAFSLQDLLIVTRTVAYLVVVFAWCVHGRPKVLTGNERPFTTFLT